MTVLTVQINGTITYFPIADTGDLKQLQITGFYADESPMHLMAIEKVRCRTFTSPSGEKSTRDRIS